MNHPWPFPNSKRGCCPYCNWHPTTLQEAYAELAAQLKLNEEDREQLLPSGRQRTYHNRIGWAKTHLMKAGLLAHTGRATFVVTERGRRVLAEGPTRVDISVLQRFPEYAAFREHNSHTRDGTPTSPPADGELETLDESLERIYQRLRDELAQELLDTVRTSSPAFFERLVVQLLVSMGYGGTVQDAGRAIGRSKDGGIDGIIKQDRLGLENIYVQAKRWQSNVGSPEVRNFAGSLRYHNASRGVLMTTADFSREAIETAQRLGGIVLINGETLARYMIEFNVGVSVAASYVVKRIDRDYFEAG